MFKNILVSLTGFESDAVALDTAYLIGRLFSARLDCICARPSPSQIAVGATPFEVGAAMNAAELIADLQKENELRSKNARLAFDAFCKRTRVRISATAADGAADGEISAAWREIRGDEVETTIEEARFHDLVVLGRPLDATALSTNGIGMVVVSAGRPVLLAPKIVPENIAPTIAIAWKDGPETARAVTAAAPLLMKTQKIVVLTADEGTRTASKSIESAERVAAQLRRHGCTAEARLVVPGGRLLPDSILETAVGCGADILVMGGYGHSRLREMVFGGFTRHVLNASPLPVLLFH
jgi:nucleotide-binding universal stress UspA family protein